VIKGLSAREVPVHARIRSTAFVAAIVIVASACAGATSPAVTLEDDGCVYRGPSDFDTGTVVTFRIINDSSESGGYAIVRVPDDETFGELARAVLEHPASEPPPEGITDFRFKRGVSAGTEVDHFVTFIEAGTYGLVCISDPNGSNRTTAGAVLVVTQ
jgi:hypothetical protein